MKFERTDAAEKKGGARSFFLPFCPAACYTEATPNNGKKERIWLS